MGSAIGDETIVADGAVPPKQLMRHKLHENAKLSKVLDLKRSHALVQCSLLSSDMVQSFFKGHDGAPAERNPNMSGRIFAVLDYRTLTAGEIKRKEELLGYSATDEDLDVISYKVDTFRTVTDILVESKYLDEINYGDDKKIKNYALNSYTYSAVHSPWNLQV